MAKAANDILEESRISMEDIIAKMLFIKKEGKGRADLRDLITQLSVLFLKLRQANRIILQEEDRVKSETENAKIPVDFTTLQLHNLMYEKNHYQKAIKACKDFKSKYPDIDLVSEEEFFRNAPEELKGDPLLKDDPHKRMLQRLNFELFQRKELCKQWEELEQRKKILQDTIANRKKFISSLPSHLKSLKKASLPVQQQLGILHTKRMKQHHLAELLPAPLYILYSQLLAQKEAFEESIDVEIVGSTKDAQSFARQQANKDSGLEEGKLDDDVPEEEDDSQRRRKRPKKLQSKENVDATGIYQVHPLSVILHIYDDETTHGARLSKFVTLRFEYLVKLHVVCVGIEGLQGGNENNFLINLFPDDTGVDLPHQTAKLSSSISFSFDEKRAQRPFKWVQHLAGIDFLPEAPPLLGDKMLASHDSTGGGSTLAGLAVYRQQHRVQTILQRIRDRKKSQLALKEQLDSLTKLKMPSLTFKDVAWATHRFKCTLHSWSVVEVRDNHVSTNSFGVEEPSTDPSLSLDGEGVSLKGEFESTREDGELPSGTHTLAINGINSYGVKTPLMKESPFDNSSRLALISKSAVPSKGKSEQHRGFIYGSSKCGDILGEEVGDDLALVLEIENDEMELAQMDIDADSASDVRSGSKAGTPWEDFSVREFCLIYRREDASRQKPVDLEAKVKISMEYPLRPPLFQLRLLSDSLKPSLPDTRVGVLDVSDATVTGASGFEWYNELRTMEAEVMR
ncbi:THO complex subunit 5A isoform X3 [Cryptomeria japonica]|uniref:THO complex subunit 5A isoform X3 n=1 Tax=Cryptomeria japonica TaxID=3369 RepID=UPI0025AD70FD|nr:THO complex subunit 5A isoform X3 [Cryptomeria japonica]